jgi:hypothetical protein
VPEEVIESLGNPVVFVRALESVADWKMKRPSPRYTCPTCRKEMETAPIDCLPLVDFVRRLGPLERGLEESALGTDPWSGFFAPFMSKNTPFHVGPFSIGIFLDSEESE